VGTQNQDFLGSVHTPARNGTPSLTPRLAMPECGAARLTGSETVQLGSRSRLRLRWRAEAVPELGQTQPRPVRGRDARRSRRDRQCPWTQARRALVTTSRPVREAD